MSWNTDPSRLLCMTTAAVGSVYAWDISGLVQESQPSTKENQKAANSISLTVAWHQQ